MRDLLWKCWRLLGAEAGGRWLFVVALAILLSGVEAASAVLIYVLLSLATGEDGTGVESSVVGGVRDLFPAWDEQTLFVATGGFIAVFFVIRGFLHLARAYAENRVVQNAAARLSVRLLRGYLVLPYAYHLSRNSSQLIRNVYQGVPYLVRLALNPLLTAINDGVLAIAILVILLVVAPLSVLLAALVLGPLAYVLLRVVHPRLKQQGRINQGMEKETLQALQQSLSGIREIKVAGSEGFFLRQFRKSRMRLARVQYTGGTLKALPRVGIETTLVILIAALFGVVTMSQGSTGQALPILGLLAYGAFRLKQPLKSIVGAVNSLRFVGHAIDDVYEDMVAGSEAVEQASRENASEPLPFKEAIEVKSVSFRYEGAGEAALMDIDLKIERGQCIGLIGQTGGGKSTLVALLVGLLTPDEGAIRVDGVDIRQRTRAWQRNIGVVPQSVFLVDDTIRRNIALGLDDDEIDERKVVRILRMVQLEETVNSLPSGLDTTVGERGVRLSGGQQQRVAIARALYREPQVLVLDEGTSALDNETEAALMDTLETLRGSLTMIIVAHRLTTVRHCDRIVVLEGGRVSDSGTYPELASRNRLFKELRVSGSSW